MFIKSKRKFCYLFICLIILSLFVGYKFKYSGVYNKKTHFLKDKKIILIDPGHGGIDGGAVSKSGTVEKNINLKISLKLKEVLEKRGFHVILTREDDIGLYSEIGKIRDKKNEDLNNRCKLKEESKCDAFISIHLNMFEQSQYYGAQVWYSKDGESAQFAHIVQQNLLKGIKNNNTRKEKCAKDAYKILRCNNDIPSLLIECGFLSNLKEEENLKTDTYQQDIANSIGRSVEEFFKIKEEISNRSEQ